VDKISRRKLLTTGGGAAVLGALMVPAAVNAQERPIRSPWAFTLDVALEPGPAMTAGAFSMGGTIFKGLSLGGDGTVPSAARPIGAYRSWGMTYDPARAPLGGYAGTHTFEIIASPDGGEGELVAEGVAGRRVPVVGGVGRFRGANGQADVTWLSPTAFRVVFDISANP
jgi:hypothetical protein